MRGVVQTEQYCTVYRTLQDKTYDRNLPNDVLTTDLYLLLCNCIKDVDAPRAANTITIAVVHRPHSYHAPP